MIEYIWSQQRPDHRIGPTNMKRSAGVPPPQKQKATKEPTTVGTLVDSVYEGSESPGISRNNCIMLCKQCKHQTISEPNHTQPNPTLPRFEKAFRLQFYRTKQPQSLTTTNLHQPLLHYTQQASVFHLLPQFTYMNHQLSSLNPLPILPMNPHHPVPSNLHPTFHQLQLTTRQNTPPQLPILSFLSIKWNKC